MLRNILIVTIQFERIKLKILLFDNAASLSVMRKKNLERIFLGDKNRYWSNFLVNVFLNLS